MKKQFVPPDGENVGANLEFPKGKVRACTSCEKGLVWVAKKIMEGNATEIKKMCLCDTCRKMLTKTLDEFFEKGKEL